MGTRYSEAFIEQALIKVFSRSDRTIKSVAEELNVNFQTVRNWIKRKSKKVGIMSVLAVKEKRPQDWNAEHNWWHCMKPMGYPAKHCMPGVVKTVYLPII